MADGQADVPVVVGLDNGGTSNNATVLRLDGRFLVDGLVETPSEVTAGPAVAIEAFARNNSQTHILPLVAWVSTCMPNTGSTSPCRPYIVPIPSWLPPVFLPSLDT